MEHYNETMQCHVHGVEYHLATGLGVVQIGAGECADMSGCTDYLVRNYPGIQQIDVVAGGVRDIRYFLSDGQWKVNLYQPPPRKPRSALTK